MCECLRSSSETVSCVATPKSLASPAILICSRVLTDGSASSQKPKIQTSCLLHRQRRETERYGRRALLVDHQVALRRCRTWRLGFGQPAWRESRSAGDDHSSNACCGALSLSSKNSRSENWSRR